MCARVLQILRGDTERITQWIELPNRRLSHWLIWMVLMLTLVVVPQPNVAQILHSIQQKNTFDAGDNKEIFRLDNQGRQVNKSEIVLLVLMSHQNELPVDFDVLKPTVQLATEYANSKYTNFRIKVKARQDPNSCESNTVGAIIAEEYFTGQLDGLIGPICSRALEGAARLASYWNVPLITAGGIGIEFSNKNIYRSLTRISLSLDRVADFFGKILQDYEWHHISLIVDESEPANTLVKTAFERKFKSMDSYRVFVDLQEFSKKQTIEAMGDDINYDKILLAAKKSARVFVLLMNGELSRNFMIHSYDLGMQGGDYAFIGVELIRSSGVANDFSWYKPGDRNNRKTKIIYESFLSLAVRVPTSPEYNLFSSKVYELANQQSNTNAINVNPMVAAFYDAVTIFAWAYNKSLTLNESISHNEKIRKLLWNNIYIDGLTGDLVINENGDRELDYTLNDFNPETGTMQPVLTYFGRRRRVEKVDGVVIHWPNNSGPPPDVPYCGYSDEALHCRNQEILPLWLIIFISLLVAALATAVISFLILKRFKAEQDLSSNWWIVDYKEISFPTVRGGGKSSLSQITVSDDGGAGGGYKSGHTTSMRGATQASTGTSLVSAAGQFDTVIVGKYRGTIVAYKPLNIKRLTMTRKTLVEFRQMRDIKHENLVRFIGLCMDEQNTAVVTELMIRGSLRDVLDNEKMQIDWTFRYSIISDIIEGMIFLHNSEIQYHGRLKSTNCVIDGRFMVKIADYGIRSLHKQVSREVEVNPRALFWTAPEHLRSSDPINHGSKAGDIYAFAIILKEVITRNAPYESNNRDKFLEPSEILDRVRMGVIPPFRPEILSPDCPNSLIKVVQACWAEDPNSRPQFLKVKAAMRKISRGVSSSNFLDNLLKRMEQYSENLEKIVEEKTESVMDEKAKTEELLYQILPKYIANELKSGRHVKPELFESATIFFSDIVGFTILSSLSSPLQVVNLLNDLYSKFDEIINLFDAFKVETIGDAYMVASGVPIRNGNDHAQQIALMAVELLKNVVKFKIRHLPEQQLKLRIGIHSGPCAAGVVGTKMPKYVVFGESVNMASRLESSGEPLKIHVSEECKKILDTFNRFTLTKRENPKEKESKDKNPRATYWLEWFQD